MCFLTRWAPSGQTVFPVVLTCMPCMKLMCRIYLLIGNYKQENSNSLLVTCLIASQIADLSLRRLARDAVRWSWSAASPQDRYIAHTSISSFSNSSKACISNASSLEHERLQEFPEAAPASDDDLLGPHSALSDCAGRSKNTTRAE